MNESSITEKTSAEDKNYRVALKNANFPKLSKDLNVFGILPLHTPRKSQSVKIRNVVNDLYQNFGKRLVLKEDAAYVSDSNGKRIRVSTKNKVGGTVSVGVLIDTGIIVQSPISPKYYLWNDTNKSLDEIAYYLECVLSVVNKHNAAKRNAKLANEKNSNEVVTETGNDAVVETSNDVVVETNPQTEIKFEQYDEKVAEAVTQTGRKFLGYLTPILEKEFYSREEVRDAVLNALTNQPRIEPESVKIADAINNLAAAINENTAAIKLQSIEMKNLTIATHGDKNASIGLKEAIKDATIYFRTGK